ncbi:HCP-like protein [Rhizoclosmatium globosum]|uniref:HCP-like protein n=1 Tax=Rhizoclosmatium globosum TaxID=329046 RepID=A0A1Y2BHY9_9FUNG|nr:HCP-like protein [Rhizoclosmatium globosum]|eukprot:ORY34401.1 HCP-like protein [Rhizoclosmatium globosum]
MNLGSPSWSNLEYAKAVHWYLKSADQGNAHAQVILGNCCEIGHGVPQDYSKAVRLYQKAAEQGNAQAQVNIVICFYYALGVSLDYAKAVHWYQKAADQGAQVKLENCDKSGYRVPQEYCEAVISYRNPVDQGYTSAQAWLGLCYENSHGVPQYYNEAEIWYQVSADNGDEYGRTGLANIDKNRTSKPPKAFNEGYLICQV